MECWWIDRAQQRAAGEVAHYLQVVAGGEDGGVDRDLDLSGLPERPNVDALLRKHLAQQRPAERMLAVVHGYDDAAVEQRRVEALLHLLLAVTLRDDRCYLAGRERGCDVDEERLAGTGRRRGERVQGGGGHGSAVERGEDGGERDRAVPTMDTEAQIAHLNDLTKDAPETDKVVCSGDDGTVDTTILMNSNDIVLVKLVNHQAAR